MAACTGLLGEPRGGVWHVFSGRGIHVEHEKKVDLGVWGDADCHGLGPGAPFSMVGGVYVKSRKRLARRFSTENARSHST